MPSGQAAMMPMSSYPYLIYKIANHDYMKHDDCP